MHIGCSLLPQGVLHLVLHMLGNGRLVDRMVRVNGCGEDTLAVTVGNLHRNNEKVHKDLKKKESPWNDIHICPPSCPSACHPEKKELITSEWKKRILKNQDNHPHHCMKDGLWCTSVPLFAACNKSSYNEEVFLIEATTDLAIFHLKRNVYSSKHRCTKSRIFLSPGDGKT